MSNGPGKKKKFESYLVCPLCECEIPMGGDERVGEEIYCPACESPLKLKKDKETDKLFLQEDF
ncbi:MAG: hypothetical protein OEV59_01370 [Deltaproteobacteria bacterium]|nr:hypothetical protein [Deltaproteobacteria bacterium]